MDFEILFVYSGGRSSKNKNGFANDFYYGYREFKEAKYKIKFIELKNSENKIIDRFLIRIFQLPIYFFKAITFSNFKIMKKSKNIIFINESTFLSFLPIIIMCKYIYKRNIIYFPMGLIDKHQRGSKFSKLIIKFSLILADKILFIGKGELNISNRIFSNIKDRSFYIPFSIDVNFWKFHPKSFDSIKDILFIGNDLNRDFDFLYELIESIPEIRFTIVTLNKSNNFKNLKNVKLIDGSWRDGRITDAEIRNIYYKSDLVVLPLKQTTQPSGQSVTLQAMSCGIPVLISKTSGFWDQDSFINNESILFIEELDLNIWKDTILKLSSSEIDLHKISKNARRLVETKHNLDNYLKELLPYLELNEL